MSRAAAGMRATRRRRSSVVESYLPLGYFGIALLLVLALLPTVLRPPQQQPNQMAELSPDAPPDRNDQAIITSLSRASSGTAGADTVAGAEDSGRPLPPPTPTKTAPRACPRGFGNPPRQTFSLYAAPCALAWQGDNGGATAKGVTRDEIRIAIIRPSKGTSYEGAVPNSPQPGENATERYYRVLQQYFNQNFQFYGRRMQLIVQTEGTNSSADRATAVNNAVAADENHHAFGVNTSQGPAIEEAARRKLVVGGAFHNSAEYMADNYPYLHGWRMDGTTMVKLGAELLCKQFVGKPANYTDDPTIVGKERVFGLIWSMQFFVGIDDEYIERELKKQCGSQFAAIVGYSYYLDQNAQNISNAVVQMRAAGVTTIECFCDYLAVSAFTAAATNQAYFPEWFMPGTGIMDSNENGQSYDPSQWRHAFGLTSWDTPMPDSAQEFWKAYKEVDPAGTPSTSNGLGSHLYYDLLMWANGIQMAGPNLTPETFMAGLMKVPRRPPDPPYSVGGGFGPGDFTYSDYVALVWWDPTATAPDNGNLGAYRYLNNSRRYSIGEIPSGPLGWFEEGVTEVSTGA